MGISIGSGSSCCIFFFASPWSSSHLSPAWLWLRLTNKDGRTTNWNSTNTTPMLKNPSDMPSGRNRERTSIFTTPCTDTNSLWPSTNSLTSPKKNTNNSTCLVWSFQKDHRTPHCTYQATNPFPTLLIGDLRVWWLTSRTKDPVDHAIPSVLLVPTKVNGRKRVELSQACLNNKLSIVPDVSTTWGAEEVGTNGHGITSNLAVATKERIPTATLHDKDAADSTEDQLSQLALDSMTPNMEVRATWPTPFPLLDQFLLPSMPPHLPSVVTDLESTTAEAVLPTVSTTPSLLSDTEVKEVEITTWSRTRGEPDGEPVDTSRWPETSKTTAVLQANLPTHLSEFEINEKWERSWRRYELIIWTFAKYETHWNDFLWEIVYILCLLSLEI